MSWRGTGWRIAAQSTASSFLFQDLAFPWTAPPASRARCLLRNAAGTCWGPKANVGTRRADEGLSEYPEVDAEVLVEVKAPMLNGRLRNLAEGSRFSLALSLSVLAGACSSNSLGTARSAFSAGADTSGGDSGLSPDSGSASRGLGSGDSAADMAGATAISAGGSRSACALMPGGTVQCWGDNTYGQLGDGTTTGPQTCCPETGDGGVCTSTPSPCSLTPVEVSGVTGAMAIAVGGFSACALLSGGAVQCWGDNTYGKLGNGTTTSSSIPVAVSGITGATAVSVGTNSACAVLSGGAVQCWGSNDNGQLGNGSTTDSPVPVAVSGLTDARAVSVGYLSACALLSSGGVQCWGDNNYAELGDGTTTGSSTPVAVTGLSSATAVSVGQEAACALLSEGTVKCWGINGYGQLGNGSNGGPSQCISGLPCSVTPVTVSGLTGATAISVGAFSSCALQSGGGARCWGFNESGDLGNGSTTGPDTCMGGVPCSVTPGEVSGLSGATAVSVGGYAACALLTGGSVECWGSNSDGELGDGATVLSPTPAMVQ
jgi:alpha-tubulin suppressor-like RCC1 family protein